MNTKKEFVVEQIFDNVFFIADKEHFDEETKKWKELPMVIHAFLVVMNSGVHVYGSISDDVRPELDNLREEANRIVESRRRPVEQHFRW